MKERRSTVSLLNGPVPEVQGFSNDGKEADGVARWLKSMLVAGYRPRDIAIFARNDGVLRDRAEPALLKAGLTSHQLSDDQPPSTTDASPGTMHRANGLELKVVVVMGCDADLMPLKYAQKDVVDDADRELLVEQERHLVYVAATRARERLLISYSGKPSRLIPM